MAGNVKEWCFNRADDRRYILSNSFRMLGDLIATYYRRAGGRGALSDQVTFRGLVEEGLDHANALVWVTALQHNE